MPTMFFVVVIFNGELQKWNLNISWSRKFLDCPGKVEMLSPATPNLGERVEKCHLFPKG